MDFETDGIPVAMFIAPLPYCRGADAQQQRYCGEDREDSADQALTPSGAAQQHRQHNRAASEPCGSGGKYPKVALPPKAL
ncbi:MAG: hypothetical protein JWO87_674 [Phycisphaerales bacterium]|nr:hypothetical protein [Phycisphaerales bacterium]